MPPGYVNTCLAAAIYTFRRHFGCPDSFCEALTALAMAAGDADTNGAVAGALLGAAHGARRLPEAWLRELPHRSWLEEQAKVVAERGGGRGERSRSYITYN